MRRTFGMPFVGVLAAMASMAVPTLEMSRMAIEPAPSQASRNKRRKPALVNALAKPCRSRAAAAPRRKKSNRLHISKRVRRKHRRAA